MEFSRDCTRDQIREYIISLMYRQNSNLVYEAHWEHDGHSNNFATIDSIDIEEQVIRTHGLWYAIKLLSPFCIMFSEEDFVRDPFRVLDKAVYSTWLETTYGGKLVIKEVNRWGK